jgi:hypothetical protein
VLIFTVVMKALFEGKLPSSISERGIHYDEARLDTIYVELLQAQIEALKRRT